MTCAKDLPPTLRAEYDAGATLRELAERHHSNISAVSLVLHADGLPLRKRGKARVSTAAQAAILARFDAGENMQAIGIAHGITRERVRQIAAEHGRTPRRKAFTALHTL